MTDPNVAEEIEAVTQRVATWGPAVRGLVGVILIAASGIGGLSWQAETVDHQQLAYLELLEVAAAKISELETKLEQCRERQTAVPAFQVSHAKD